MACKRSTAAVIAFDACLVAGFAGVVALATGCTAADRPRKQPPAPPPATSVVVVEPPAPIPRCPFGVAGSDGLTYVERTLRDAVRDAQFDAVMVLQPPTPEQDGGAREAQRSETGTPGGSASQREAPSALRLGRSPSVDVAIVAYPEGCLPVFANAMLLRDASVRVNRFDPRTLALRSVRLRRWDQARWESAEAAHPPFHDDDDLVPPPDGEASTDFVVPYPASGFKLLVAVKLLQLVDRGALRHEDRIVQGARSKTLARWIEGMITTSDDESTRVLLKRLHAMGEAAQIDALFAQLGLGTLQLHDTSAETGRNWQPGRIHMTAWDTVRLLWLLDPDAPPPTWITPAGTPVDPGFLSLASRRFLMQLLHQQAFHDALSTTALCRLPHTRSGIPALLDERWIGADGRPLVAIGRGVSEDIPGADVRSCNAEAKVTFAHKTGLTENFGSDLGIVQGIPGRARRHYAIAFFSNLGYRYTDADKAKDPDPCRNLGICYTQRIAAMGGAIDQAMAKVLEAGR